VRELQDGAVFVSVAVWKLREVLGERVDFTAIMTGT
jgi:hypothetical protein